GFRVQSLSQTTRRDHTGLYGTVAGQRLLDAFEEHLQDNTLTPIPDQVAFRIDWPAWLATLTPRDRQIIRQMAHAERTRALAKRFELSPARISQLRREYHDGWARFCGDDQS